MRLEATVPDSRGTALMQLAGELGLSRSQIVDEALALFLKAVLEVRRGRRLVTVDPESTTPVCELATPTLTALEWTTRPVPLRLSSDAVRRMADLAAAPAEPSETLREAVRRRRRRDERG